MSDIYYLGTIVVLSISNAVVYLRYIKAKKRSNKTESAELSEFLVDLMQGDGLVKISRISPSDILLRSPRHKR